MSEAEGEGLELVFEDADLRFRKVGRLVLAELVREGKEPILLAAVRPSLISTPDTKALYYQMIDALLTDLMTRNGVEMIARKEGN